MLLVQQLLEADIIMTIQLHIIIITITNVHVALDFIVVIVNPLFHQFIGLFLIMKVIIISILIRMKKQFSSIGLNIIQDKTLTFVLLATKEWSKAVCLILDKNRDKSEWFLIFLDSILFYQNMGLFWIICLFIWTQSYQNNREY